MPSSPSSPPLPPQGVPLPNTYWVVPGRLLAGEHPYGADEADARERLGRLCGVGMDFFVDLTEADERPDYGPLLPHDATHLRCAIPDTYVPDEPAQMHALQTRIRAALLEGRGVYVHCRAGIGRTGLVIGCYLADDGLDGSKALKLLNRLWRQSARAKSWPTVPQTVEQAEYIKRWPQYRKSLLSQGIDS